MLLCTPQPVLLECNHVPELRLGPCKQLGLLVLQFLAFRLSEVKLSCEHLTADLNMTMVSPTSMTLGHAVTTVYMFPAVLQNTEAAVHVHSTVGSSSAQQNNGKDQNSSQSTK